MMLPSWKPNGWFNDDFMEGEHSHETFMALDIPISKSLEKRSLRTHHLGRTIHTYPCPHKSTDVTKLGLLHPGLKWIELDLSWLVKDHSPQNSDTKVYETRVPNDQKPVLAECPILTPLSDLCRCAPFQEGSWRARSGDSDANASIRYQCTRPDMATLLL